MEKQIKLYSNTGCSKCVMLKKWMAMKQIPYEELNISENEEARQNLLAKGYRQLPQIEIDGEIIEFEEYNDILKYV
ncbi:glutaredoxin family protein [Helcococcus kunzii]|uniref:glutaredoxin family protein n=1 Tax=Helcococcus kunzii TaxID=40091 RepID=UPI001C95526A|nr:glutaredoxin family protein [Helcococcus kunzii]MCT1796829.1 glutaredoxin family protein [Helcococcus kunzii]MCT1988387.1 glutaredoxin family protein [Helcococcus kunzii]QZO76191.1 glutaredoxin family protein [Helcococcus kunzii]